MTDKKFSYTAFMKEVAAGPNDHPIGDLARDILADDKFPKDVKTEKQLVEYLEGQNAFPPAIDAAHVSWRFYEAIVASL